VDLLGALADPVRREILERLRGGPLTAGEIAAAFPISRPAVSRHVRVLRAAGLVVEVADGADGRSRTYRLDPRPLSELDHWLAAFRPAWSAAALEALETEVHRARRDRRRGTVTRQPTAHTERSTA
jgi:DNA-binding transcriptional ArsR family regulator